MGRKDFDKELRIHFTRDIDSSADNMHIKSGALEKRSRNNEGSHASRQQNGKGRQIGW